MKKTLLRALIVAVALMFIISIVAYGLVRASLPKLDGDVNASKIAKSANIERDAQGVVTITSGDAQSLAFSLGYAHAQDRRFQMDLLRRSSAGELSELVGAATIEMDKKMRTHRLRPIAREVLKRASEEERQWLSAYADGVNAGTESLSVRPFEYLLLRTQPTPWLAEDSVLVLFSMLVDLQISSVAKKVQRYLLHESLPKPVFDFVYQEAADWEAAVDDTHSDRVAIPDATIYDLRQHAAVDLNLQDSEHVLGSNNWVLSGRRSEGGAALVANDMHLQFRVPNIWYRARLRLNNSYDATGVTLAGAPALVAGSNGHVAWGFTNSYGDFMDLVVVVPDPKDKSRYLTAGGSLPFEHHRERIDVKGADAVDIDVLTTQFGPIVDRDAQGRFYALEWTAHKAEAINFNVHRFVSAKNASEMLAIAATCGIPAQNIVIGDESGNIAWTIAGRIPKWKRASHWLPALSTDSDLGFDGWLNPEEYPRLENPANGQIATANARVVGGEALAKIGDGGYDIGARAKRIQKLLSEAGNKQTPADMLAIQLDDAAVFLDRWYLRLQHLLDDNAVAKHPQRAELKRILTTWSGHAGVNEVAYTYVKAFRSEVAKGVFKALITPALKRNPNFGFLAPNSFEGPLHMLLTAQAAHMVPPGFSSWQDFLLNAVDASIKSLEPKCARMSECTWGSVNLPSFRHPLSLALPILSRFLDIPDQPMPGDSETPRVITPRHGASERFAVSPSREAEGYFEMPGGQSGHPLSLFYADEHDAWVRGERMPFLPGPTVHLLKLNSE